MEKIETAFVLGAGLGTRLRPLTDALPKPLLPVRGRPLMEIIFDSLIDCGVERFIVNTHHLAEKYTEHFKDGAYRGKKIIFAHEETLLDTGGGVKNILNLIDPSKPLIVYNGDIFFDGDLGGFASASLKRGDCAAALMLRSEGDNKNVSVRGGNVVDLRFTRGAAYGKLAQFAGVFIANEKYLKACADYRESKFSSVDVFLKLLGEDENSLAAYFEDGGLWSDIGTIKEYERLSKNGD